MNQVFTLTEPGAETGMTRSIKWKLVRSIMLIAASCLLLSGAGLLLENRFQFERNLNQSLDIFARVLAENSQAALAFNDPASAGELLAALRVNEHIVQATLWDRDGRLFSRYTRPDLDPQDIDEPAPTSSSIWLPELLKVSVPVMHQNQRLGRLDIIGDTRQWRDSLSRFLSVTLSIIILVLAAATWVAIKTQRIFTRPIASLLETMGRVSAARNYALRATHHADDELGRLVHGFNRMLGEIENRDRDILATKVDLERKVSELDQEIRRHIQTQASLETREHEYRLLFEQSPMPMWVVASDSLRFLSVNQAAVKHYGYSHAEFLDLDINRIITGEGTEKDTRPGLSHLTPHPSTITHHRHKNGAQIIAQVAWHEITWQGKPAYLFLVNDITEREHGARALRDSEARIRAILDAAFDCIVSMDEDGRILEFNPAAERTFGYRRDEVIGKSLAEIMIPPIQREAHTHGLKRLLETKQPRMLGRRIETSGLRRNGETFPVELAVSPVTVSERSYFTGYLRDITEHKRAQDELRRSEERYRSLITATAQIVWTTDPEGRIAGPLPEWQAYTGQSVQDVQGEGWMAALHPEDRQITTGVWQRAVQARGLYESECRIRNRDGEYRFFHARGVPVKNADGSIKEWVGTCTDITARKLAEQEIRQLTQDLERRVRERTAQLEVANRELEAFSYSVSHDLRAPLRAIDGFSKALMSDYASRLDARALNYFERVRNASQRMGQLIDDMLKLSRVTRTELRPTDIDLSAMTRRIGDELRAAHPERNIDIVIAPDLRVRGDPALMEIAWRNLIENAWKFTRERDPARIEIGSKIIEGETAYYIQDNGAGFDMSYSDKLFGAFQRLHSTTEFEGTGVGLATVHRIVTKHGGRVWAHGEPDKGAGIFMTIPKQGDEE